jgi:hypothetical protein
MGRDFPPMLYQKMGVRVCTHVAAQIRDAGRDGVCGREAPQPRATLPHGSGARRFCLREKLL